MTENTDEDIVDTTPLTGGTDDQAAQPTEDAATGSQEGVQAAPEAAADDDQSERDRAAARAHHEAREAKRLTRQLQSEIAAMKAAQQPAETDEQAMERKIEERATQKAHQTAFVKTATAIYEAGKSEYGKEKWDEAINSLAEQTGGTAIPPVIVEAAHDTGDAHKILSYLAEHLDEYDAILNAPLHSMGTKIAKIGAQLAAKPTKQVSKAPPPIHPVGGNSKADVNPDDMPIDEYIKYENRRELKRKGYIT